MSSLTSASKQRALLVLGVLLYIACFQWMYINWVNPTFAYYGFEYSPPGTAFLALGWVLSVLPSLWMPIAFKRPSQLAYWVLYSTVFIPCMFVPLYAGLCEPSRIAWLMLALFAGLAITGLSNFFPLLSLRPPQVRSHRFWFGFAVLAIAATLCVVVAFRGQFRIVSFSDIYDVRLAADDVMAGTLLNYPLMWLYGAINPFLMGWGLYHKKILFFVAGSLGQVIVYGVMGTKASILSIFFVTGFHFLLRGNRLPFALKLIWSIVALVGGAYLYFVATGQDPDPLLQLILTVVIMRLFSMPAVATAQYHAFLQNHPHTYFSHVKGISWLVHYPYGNTTVGGAVGDYFFNDFRIDQTTQFWATDGLASFGLPGVLLVSAFCAFFFWVLDSAAKRHDPRLAALLISYVAYNLANGGLFTTLLSGGGGLLIVILYLMPGEQSELSCEPEGSRSVVGGA